MSHCITHPSESTRCSRFYLAGAFRDTEPLLTPAGDGQNILSLSSSRLKPMAREHQRLGKAQQNTHTITQCLRTFAG
jgi:hypothetical protein